MSCKNSTSELSNIHVQNIPVDSSYKAIQEVEAYIRPFRERVDQVLDSTLAYIPYSISKTDHPYNTTAGNLMADMLYEQANPIFKKRTGKDIDFVLFNHGGIRSGISKGNVSARTAYEVMPFENSIAVTTMKGDAIKEMIDYIVRSKRAHPIAKLQIILNTDGSLKEFRIQGKPFDPSKTYYVATSNYLVSGGDDMVFFKDVEETVILDYKVRNALIDYFTKVDTLSPKIDNRYYKLK
ncbi:5'-nucleotidase C-terminal domain-containing protein [Maribacter sp. 2210JD10-5]|uniref:5'-nucleotidase C-terminal domain-containing protein n=1 Tax=Maribacter sp. 2210JD10-5 TaxID=3386272 RepID=UPI0039BC55D2